MGTIEKMDVRDSQLEEKVENALPKSATRFPIQVIAKNGKVLLFGFVDTLALKNEIEAVVQSVPGVNIVTNHLRIKPWEEKRSETHI